MKEIGELYNSESMKIMETDEGEYVVQRENGETIPLTGEDAYCYLCKPWDSVNTYTDEDGIHWRSIVYDSIWIDVWAPDLKQLLNLVVNMMDFSDKTNDFLYEQIKESNKKEREDNGKQGTDGTHGA